MRIPQLSSAQQERFDSMLPEIQQLPKNDRQEALMRLEREDRLLARLLHVALCEPPSRRDINDLPFGMRCGGYELRGRLSAGTFGVVYRASDPEFPDVMLAVKIIRPLRLQRENFDRFNQELNHLVQLRPLRHRGVACFHGSGSLKLPSGEDVPFLVTEYVDGAQLDEFCHRAFGELPPGERAVHCVDLFVQVCDAVQAVHAKGILHSDLKPENILVRSDPETLWNQPVVMDFGLAQNLDPNISLAALGGTISYMSPEHFAEKGLDARSDVYSLGVILFRMVTGNLPYGKPTSGDATQVLREAITCGHLPLLATSQMHVVLRDTLAKALALAPVNRFQTVAEFGRKLSEWRSEQSEWALLQFHQHLPAYLRFVIQQLQPIACPLDLPSTSEGCPIEIPPLADYFSPRDVLCERDKTKDHGSAHEDRELERISALKFVSQHPHVALLGEPDSGKTSFVRYLAFVLACDRLRRENVDNANLQLPDISAVNLDQLGDEWKCGPLLPVRVSLRDLVDKRDRIGEPIDECWSFIRSELELSCRAFMVPLQDYLCEHGGLLILEGYDEAAGADDPDGFLAQVIKGFQEQFPRVRILLTSRSYVYEDTLAGFRVGLLTPFSDDQIKTFVDRWYSYRAKTLGLSAESGSESAAQLRREIAESPFLEELARCPLLLTLTAALHPWRRGEPKRNREAFYDKVTQQLLQYWEDRKPPMKREAGPQQEIAAEWFKGLPERALKAFEGIAFTAHEHQPDLIGAADIPEATVVDALINTFPGGELEEQHVIKHIRERSGLLLYRGEGIYCFPHRVLQEYLAARYLARVRFPDYLVELVRCDFQRWREIVLLACGRAARSAAKPVYQLVRELSPIDADLDRPANDLYWSRALLAGHVLAESGVSGENHGDEKSHESVIRSLAEIVDRGYFSPVDRSAAGISLATLGDTRPGVGVSVAAPSVPEFSWCGISDSGPFPNQPFQMGGDPEAWGGFENPFFCTRIEKPFFIAKYPVTVAQYYAFLQGAPDRIGAEAISKWKEKSALCETTSHPCVNVSWIEAHAFCKWLNEPDIFERLALPRGALHIRLATEAEWEMAAGWNPTGERRVFPWGNPASEQDFDSLSSYCNSEGSGIGATSVVGLFPKGAAACGAMDMAGNVWEWCLTKWQSLETEREQHDYNGRTDREDEDGDERRVLRGGSWGRHSSGDLRIACRTFGQVFGFPANRSNHTGFRVVCVMKV